MRSGSPHTRQLFFLALLGALVVPTASCGGGGGGPGPGGAGQGLILQSFVQGSLDNLPINRVLEFRFSEAVDPTTITAGTMETVGGASVLNPLYGPGSGSIQIRLGSAFGLTAPGTFFVDGSVVRFQPQLPSSCGLADAGFQPGSVYRVQLMGYPEEFSIKNSQGQPLEKTLTYEIGTLPDTDPAYLEDQIPGALPRVLEATVLGDGYALTRPASGGGLEAASVPGVDVHAGNGIAVSFSENIDPCTVNDLTVRFYMYELGDKDLNEIILSGPTAGNTTGFDSITDAAPNNHYSWGSTNATKLDPPQKIPATIAMSQTFDDTQLIVRPVSGVFPENALIVLDLTRDLLDFGSQPLAPLTICFTTENLPAQSAALDVEFDATTPIDDPRTSADVNTVRSPSRAQGWLIFAGDGDNGDNADQDTPSYPITPTNCAFRPNDNYRDDFNPNANMTLDTGATRNSCSNPTDGSAASIWEFGSFTIGPNITVRIVGANPAIILVDGDVHIQPGGTLLLQGNNGKTSAGSGSYYYPGGKGGAGVAGSGEGGEGGTGNGDSAKWGEDGGVGYGSPDYPASAAVASDAHGGGQGGTKAVKNYYPYYQWNANGQGGGGGGHGTVGTDGTAQFISNGGSQDAVPAGTIRGKGGFTYPDGPNAVKMFTPSAGSGGGGAGGFMQTYSSGYYYYDAGGGGGGAGGGFVDITAAGNIRIAGRVDVRGGNGGSGASSYYSASNGGGGGSGGGIRLLTPNHIDLRDGELNASGGTGGTGSTPSYTGYWQGPIGNGGAGGLGRIALEDGDSVIGGMSDGSAILFPDEGEEDAFWRGVFNPDRFSGSSGAPSIALTQPMFTGSLAPTLFDLTTFDMIAGIPTTGSRGAGKVAVVIEAQGFGLKPDATVDLGSATPWYTVGCISESGVPNDPGWHPGANPSDLGDDASLDPANAGKGIHNLDGSLYVALRLTFVLPADLGALDPGPYVDYLHIPYTADQ